MYDAEGTELQPGDIVEWLRDPEHLLMVTEKQDSEPLIRAKCLCQGCQNEGDTAIFYFEQHRVRLVERMPTPEYYKHMRSG